MANAPSTVAPERATERDTASAPDARRRRPAATLIAPESSVPSHDQTGAMSSDGAHYPAAQRQSGARILCEALEQEGVEVLFGYPGGTIMPFYDALATSKLRHVLVRHEQGAAHAADGYARASGKVGVCVATSGPGATNLVTGLATAYADSIPVVAITGQVARRLIGTDAFQETDIIGITQAITKHSILVTAVEELAESVHRAFAIARSGRPGPVLIDIPKDVQQATTDAPPPFTPAAPRQPRRATSSTDFEATIDAAVKLIDAAQRPLILAGHGVLLANAGEALRAFAERSGVPVITTLLGLSAIPETHPLAIGMPGMHGLAEVNHAIHHADTLIAVGMRFDDRVTGDIPGFAPHAHIVHIDIDPSEMGKVLPPTVPVVADARVALDALTQRITPSERHAWRERIAAWRNEAAHATPNADGMSNTGDAGDRCPTPAEILAAIRQATNGRAVLITDVGQHQMWAARFYGYEHFNSHLTSGGLGTMGFALPAALGAAFARPDAPIWVVAGDGGIQMNIQELATIAEVGAPIKIAIVNNGYLGMVRQWQEFFYQRNYSETRITGPDYVTLGRAYGVAGFQVTRADEVAATVAAAMAVNGPAIIDFVIEREENVFPMVPPGKSNVEMIERAPTAPATQAASASTASGGRHAQ